MEYPVSHVHPINNLRVKTAVLEAIAEAWPKGICWSKDTDMIGRWIKDTDVVGLRMHDIQIRGKPWHNAEDDINGTRNHIQCCHEVAVN